MSDRTRVVVVGTGASGTLAAVHLLRAAIRLELVLVDRSGEFGPGKAYRTADPAHLLNTPAGKMSALADDPGHFVRWSRAQGRAVDAGTFLPRGDYGRYLAEALSEQERTAGRSAVVRRVTDTATGLAADGNGVTVELARNGSMRADFAVLATGVGSGDPLADMLPDDSLRYVVDPWAGPLEVADGSTVLVLGTGLSMMDLAVSITRKSPDSVVHAVSRHGLLPRPHRPGPPGPPSAPEPPQRIGSLGDLLGFARRCVAADPDRWRDFVDRLRPHAPRLWQQLDVADRQRFLDRVDRYWDVHRHRAAPATHRRVHALLGAGRLRLHRGRVTAVRPTGDGFDVELAGGPAATRTLRVGWLLNTTGFRRDVGDPLVHRLLADGTAHPDLVGLGVRTGGDGRMLDRRGEPSRIFTLGALRRGELFESTAVPEIRAQAARIASTVTALPTPPV
ncbi:FAD/NAD(P)-binding protein [Lentzea californiensis]|uniref:FAD/NAD(P)-binding protein n=1 Tax=Lentzea californiensis TaxID=438851 RepID=UPI00216648DE|nr:FAD/NAD(P)-binding protein [Lentzea californiensis]MCR3750107.1 putative NAD(P)/FAD-binding protein YdhS [Lentzea californiensis]